MRKRTANYFKAGEQTKRANRLMLSTKSKWKTGIYNLIQNELKKAPKELRYYDRHERMYKLKTPRTKKEKELYSEKHKELVNLVEENLTRAKVKNAIGKVLLKKGYGQKDKQGNLIGMYSDSELDKIYNKLLSVDDRSISAYLAMKVSKKDIEDLVNSNEVEMKQLQSEIDNASIEDIGGIDIDNIN